MANPYGYHNPTDYRQLSNDIQRAGSALGQFIVGSPQRRLQDAQLQALQGKEGAYSDLARLFGPGAAAVARTGGNVADAFKAQGLQRSLAPDTDPASLNNFVYATKGYGSTMPGVRESLENKLDLAGVNNKSAQTIAGMNNQRALEVAQLGNQNKLALAAMSPLNRGQTRELPPSLAQALGISAMQQGLSPAVNKNELVPVPGSDGRPVYANAAEAAGQTIPDSPAGGASGVKRYQLLGNNLRLDTVTGRVEQLAIGQDGSAAIVRVWTPDQVQGAARAAVQSAAQGAAPAAPGADGAAPVAPDAAGAAPASPTVDPTATPLLSQTQDPQLQAAKTQAVEDAKAGVKQRWGANDAYSRFEQQLAPLDRLDQSVDELMSAPGLDKTLGAVGQIPNFPGSEAADAEAKKEMLKSQIAATVLNMYRSMSKTGGAVGQVSDYEQKMFQNQLAALDSAQSPQSFREQIKKIKDFVAGSKQRLQNAYSREYSSPGSVPTIQPDQAQSAPSGIKFLGFE